MGTIDASEVAKAAQGAVTITAAQLDFVKLALLTALETVRDFLQMVSVLVAGLQMPAIFKDAYGKVASAISFNFLPFPTCLPSTPWCLSAG